MDLTHNIFLTDGDATNHFIHKDIKAFQIWKT